MEYGEKHSRDRRQPVPCYEEDNDEIYPAVSFHEEVCNRKERTDQVSRSRDERPRQLLHDMRGGGTYIPKEQNYIIFDSGRRRKCYYFSAPPRADLPFPFPFPPSSLVATFFLVVGPYLPRPP